MAEGTYVAGLRETVNALVAAGVEVEELKDTMGAIAAEAVETMRPLIPERTGKLRGSVRGNRAKNKAVVTVGRATVPYARIVNKRARYVERTDAVMETKAVSMLEEGLDAITRKHGLQ